MIKRLQQKIVIIITLLLAVSVLVVMLAINIVAQSQSVRQLKDRMSAIADQNGIAVRGDIDPYQGEDSAYIDNFSVIINNYNEIVQITFNRDIIVNEDDIIEYVNSALQTQQEFGFLGRYAFLVSNKHSGKIIVFLDATTHNQQTRNLIITTSMIGVAAVILFFLLAVGLSFWLVKPVKETFEGQKRFISNASHELKTPLAVISANADVLEAEIGENKWLGYIHSEASRMSELVNELLFLARIDDKSGHKMVTAEFSLTDTVLQTALPFESRMFEEGKKFDVDAQEGVMLDGDQSAIKHVLTILIDNAVKYSAEKGEISVKLYTKNNKKILEVYNTGVGIKPDKLDKIFERFYREDEARNSKSGGYGLGLSIAYEVVKMHKGTIKAESDYGHWVRFTAMFN